MSSAARGAKKERLDVLLVERGLVDSREKAKRLIMAGQVMWDTTRVEKPGQLIPADAALTLKEAERFVSRAGYKLEGALEAFGIQVVDRVCLDVGASTGGFTDCLLQRGAKRVMAIDVGHGQFHGRLQQDERVWWREGFNARYLRRADLPEEASLAVMDLSFISLTLVLPAVGEVLSSGADILALIKPQFELARDEVARGGIVKEPELREKAVAKIRDFVRAKGELEWKEEMPSVVKGSDGNQEYVAWLRKREMS